MFNVYLGKQIIIATQCNNDIYRIVRELPFLLFFYVIFVHTINSLYD